MVRLVPAGLRCLELLHAIGAAVWVGSGVALSASQLSLSAVDGRALHGKLAALEHPGDRRSLRFGSPQVASLIVAVVLTVLRPWRRRSAPGGPWPATPA